MAVTVVIHVARIMYKCYCQLSTKVSVATRKTIIHSVSHGSFWREGNKRKRDDDDDDDENDAGSSPRESLQFWQDGTEQLLFRGTEFTGEPDPELYEKVSPQMGLLG